MVNSVILRLVRVLVLVISLLLLIVVECLIVVGFWLMVEQCVFSMVDFVRQLFLVVKLCQILVYLVISCRVLCFLLLLISIGMFCVGGGFSLLSCVLIWGSVVVRLLRWLFVVLNWQLYLLQFFCFQFDLIFRMSWLLEMWLMVWVMLVSSFGLWQELYVIRVLILMCDVCLVQVFKMVQYLKCGLLGLLQSGKKWFQVKVMFILMFLYWWMVFWMVW